MVKVCQSRGSGSRVQGFRGLGFTGFKGLGFKRV